MNIRIGHGFDTHRLVEQRTLILGGVTIPYQKGLDGHSDADVVIHALCDALLGAMGLGDIGTHFPDTDIKFKNIDSRFFLKEIFVFMSKENLIIGNVDITILAQNPKIVPYISSMKKNIAEDLSTETKAINIKATTTEGMGYIGQGKGISVHAVVLLVAN